jgi:Protein of unknwon function (DUF3310)
VKTSKTAKILALLDKGNTVKQTAAKVGTTPNYVYYVKWNAAKKTGKTAVKKKAAKKAKSVKLGVESLQMKLPLDDLLAKRAQDDADLTASETAHTEVRKTYDEVNHPYHYTAGGIETIDFIEAKGLGYNLGNVIKYVSRAFLKNSQTEGDIKDLEKAQWYLKREIDTLRKGL